MKKLFTILALTIIISVLAAGVSSAATTGWVYINPIGWFYDLGGSTSPGSTSRYAKNVWMWIPDGSNQRVMYCYYFGPDGRMYQNQTTPDNYQVDDTGAWVVNGVRQWKLNENYKEPTTPVIPVQPCPQPQPCPCPQPRRDYRSSQDISHEVIMDTMELHRRERKLINAGLY